MMTKVRIMEMMSLGLRVSFHLCGLVLLDFLVFFLVDFGCIWVSHTHTNHTHTLQKTYCSAQYKSLAAIIVPFLSVIALLFIDLSSKKKNTQILFLKF